MKRTIIVGAVVAVIFGVSGYFIGKGYATNQEASVFSSASVPALTTTGMTTLPTDNIQLMHGTCVVDTGNYLTSYAGHFNPSYDCIRNIAENNLLTFGTNSITASSPTAYLSNSATIAILQAKLIILGFLNQVEPDGSFSVATFNAIKALQTKNNIPATGYLDSATLKVLNNVEFQSKTLGGQKFLGVVSQ